MKFKLLLLLLIPAFAIAQPTSKVLSLDGTNDYAYYSGSNLLADTGDWTVEMWWKICDVSTNQRIFDSRGSSAGNGVELSYFGSYFAIGMQGADGYLGRYARNITYAVTENTWYHIALTHRHTDSFNVLFINGNPEDTFTQQFTGRSYFYLGRHDVSGALYGNGNFDDVRFSTTIRYTGAFVPPTTLGVDGLTNCFWDFEVDKDSTNFMDISGKGHTLVGKDGAHIAWAVGDFAGTEFCNGDSALLTAPGGGRWFEWIPSTGLSNPNARETWCKVSSNITYQINGLDSNSCDTTIKFVSIIVNPLPTVSGIVSDDTICTDGFTNLTAIGGVSYVWSPGTYLSDSTTVSPIFDPGPAGVYTIYVEGTDAQGCKNMDSVQIVVELCTDIDEISMLGISIAPNPVNDLLQINGVDGSMNWRIIDLSGRAILHDELSSSGLLDLSSLEAGYYMIELEYNDRTYYHKLIKQ